MLSVHEGIDNLLQSASNSASNLAADSHMRPLNEALGCVLAEDIYSQHDVPPEDNSAMDGYALHCGDLSQDLAKDSPMVVSQRIQAGDAPQALRAGTAARIFTGAEIPAGANCVVMQENVTLVTDDSAQESQANTARITINTAVKAGDNIRRRGQDIAKNTVVLAAGARLRAQEIGLLASIGVAEVKVRKALKVGILNTGNELVEPGQPLGPGKIYNSNRFLLDAILRGWGFQTEHHQVAEDTLTATKHALTSLANKVDIVISTGGVSVGEEDHIKPAIESLGQLTLWKIAIKPGKPFAFGDIAGTPFLGLPGNPASAFVTLLVLARPYLLTLQGAHNKQPGSEVGKAKALFSKKASARTEYLRGKLCDCGVEVYANQSSGVLSSASWGNCLVIQEPGQDIGEGDDVTIIFYATLLSP